jgi:hypothetical protein
MFCSPITPISLSPSTHLHKPKSIDTTYAPHWHRRKKKWTSPASGCLVVTRTPLPLCHDWTGVVDLSPHFFLINTIFFLINTNRKRGTNGGRMWERRKNCVRFYRG